MTSALLQDLLRPHVVEHLNRRLAQSTIGRESPEDSGDELIDVLSLPGSPARSRPSSRPPSPTKGANRRPVPGPLLLSTKSKNTDPLRSLPTEISQRIFGLLDIGELARCSRVSKKWNRSQSINYVWFQQYRKENFHDDSLPSGKWTKRESKQNWRLEYIKTVSARDADIAHTPFTRPSTPSIHSGYQTPREVREEQWRLEAQISKPGKVEMREMYKELGGRKSRNKTKVGASSTRDKGGWADGDDL